MEFDPSNVDFKWLRESGMYDEKMLDEIEKNHTFESLENPDMANKLKNAEFALPLLYACCRDDNEKLYEIYKYIGYGVQNNLNDLNLSRRILLNAEKLEIIDNTPLAKEEDLILECVTIRSEVVGHISDQLMKDGEFVDKLSKQGPIVVKEMVEKYPVENLIAANPSLANNPQFMAEAISKDVNAIKYMPKEMLNNYDVFSNSSKENDKVADYVLQHIEEFGDNAVKGARDGSTEGLRVDTVAMLKELLEKYDGYSDIERQLKHFEAQDKESNYPYKAKSLVQVIVKNRLIRPDENELNKIFNIVDLDKELLERQFRENPELIISQEEFGALPTPDELKGMIEKSQLEDKEKFAERLKKYEKFHTMAKEHKSEEKKPKEKREVVRETQKERDTRLRAVDTKGRSAEQFNKARKYIEENENYRPKPETLRGLLEKSELKDDQEAIAWLEEYTKYYEQQHEKIQEEVKEEQEHNAELSVTMLTITASRNGIEQEVTYTHTDPDGIRLTPEQLHQLEVDLAARKVAREKAPEVTTPTRGREELGQDR